MIVITVIGTVLDLAYHLHHAHRPRVRVRVYICIRISLYLIRRATHAMQVMTGQEFVRPLKNLPGQWLIKFILSIFRKLSPSMEGTPP